ncbi:MAG: PIG-L deacetylase family protein [Ferrimicrobium sp.]
MNQRDGIASYLGADAPEFTQNRETPRSALAIGAHPDDVEFGAGGTLAKWAHDGCAIFILILTDGRRGTWDRSQNLGELAQIRRKEAKCASRKLSPKAKLFTLDLEDGTLSLHPELVKALVHRIRKIQPEVILSHDPWKRYRIHPDHRSAGFLVTDAIAMARDHTYFPHDSQPPHRPNELLLFEADQVDHTESIKSTLTQKATALACHRSQYPSSFAIPIDTKDPVSTIEHQLLAASGTSEGFKRVRDL